METQEDFKSLSLSISSKDTTGKNYILSQLKRDSVLIKLSSGMTVAAIARELNVNAKHIHDYLRGGEGFERLESSLRDARAILEQRLPNMVSKALDILESDLNAPYMTATKLNSAKTVIQTVAKLSTARRCPNCADSSVVN
jgi:hypothetical protein